MILVSVGDSDLCVGEVEGSVDGMDGLGLEGVGVFADGCNEGIEDILLGGNDDGTNNIEGVVVSNPDPFCVGEKEGSFGGTVDGLGLEGLTVGIEDILLGGNGVMKGANDFPLGKNVAVGTGDIEGNIVGNFDPLSVGRAEGLSDSTVDGLRLKGNSVFVGG